MSKFWVLVLVGCTCLLSIIPISTGAQTFDSGWMYLSTSPDHYNPGLDDPRWEGGTFKEVYLIVENPPSDWGEDNYYTGVEFSLNYPSSVAFVSLDSPDCLNPLFTGTTTNGLCDGVVAGCYTKDNPWVAVRIQFFTLGHPDNILFTLAPIIHAPYPDSFKEAPGWAYSDGSLHWAFPATSVSQGSGVDHKPDWYAGIVLLNYNPATIAPEMLSDLSERVQDPGHPLWMHAVPVQANTWGTLKAGWR